MAKQDKFREPIIKAYRIVDDEGEIVHEYKRIENDIAKRFWKCYLEDFMNVLEIIDNKQLRILAYICRKINPTTNTFTGTYAKIKKDIEREEKNKREKKTKSKNDSKCENDFVISQPTIVLTMKKLQETNFIRKVQNGVWLVNPNILVKGRDEKRHRLFIEYLDTIQKSD